MGRAKFQTLLEDVKERWVREAGRLPWVESHLRPPALQGWRQAAAGLWAEARVDDGPEQAPGLHGDEPAVGTIWSPCG